MTDVTDGTLLERSAGFLDWPAVAEALATEARSARGQAICLALPFARDAAEARAWIAEVSELVAILAGGESLPGLAFPEVEALVDAAEKGQLLSAEELGSIALLCESAEAARRFFDDRKESAARVWAIAGALDPREEIARRVRSTFDSAGEIRESVSPELGRLRREREGLATRVREEVERLSRSDEFAGVLQDQFVTLRAERFVLPLKASAKSLGLGIVHDTSRSGETVFVEPTQVVGMNNRLKVAELEIARETRRILEEIRSRVADAAPALRANGEMLARLDVIAAKARLSVATGGSAAEIVEDAIVDLRRARHPLLVLRGARQGFDVVANDVDLVPPKKVLLITGPNAGGKTVLLKTIGLAALMARAGMHVPAASGSRIGFFDPVLADIGDQQTVMGDLSTFSAHLANVGAILEAAATRAARALALVDELMVGTNPDQGAALARATLEALADGGGLCVATTHYDALKALAQKDERFRNAAMEYDVDELLPTFRLREGVPGRSYALDIATRLGLPKDVLSRARALAGKETIGLEEAIARLEAREAELAREADALARAKRDAEAAAGAGREAAEKLEARERELALHSRRAIEDAVAEARETIRAIVRQAQAAATERAAAEARRELEQAVKTVTAALPKEPPAPGDRPASIAEGAKVFVPSLKSEATVVKVGKGKAKVAVGALTFDVAVEELRAPKKPDAAKTVLRKPAPRPEPSADSLSLARQSQANTLDLRGMRADDALAQVESFLDKMSLAGTTPVFLIHGFGTGALRKAVREYLARSPYVQTWKPGEKEQGGDGVSVVAL